MDDWDSDAKLSGPWTPSSSRRQSASELLNSFSPSKYRQFPSKIHSVSELDSSSYARETMPPISNARAIEAPQASSSATENSSLPTTELVNRLTPDRVLSEDHDTSSRDLFTETRSSEQVSADLSTSNISSTPSGAPNSSEGSKTKPSLAQKQLRPRSSLPLSLKAEESQANRRRPVILPNQQEKDVMNPPGPEDPRISLSGSKKKNDSGTTAQRDKFLVKKRDVFLPLLPRKNYIQSIVDKGENSSLQEDRDIVLYESLQKQPRGLTVNLKPYQLKGLSFLLWLHRNGMSGILADEMGLGKTIQTLSLLQYLKETSTSDLKPALVVCPLSVLQTWVSEAAKFTPSLLVIRMHGAKPDKEAVKDRFRPVQAQKKGLARPDLIVTTYEVFACDASWFKRVKWSYIILDEGHKIKNDETQISKCLFGTHCEFKLILTGTPIQNDLKELWSLLHFLLPEVFTEKTSEVFKTAFDLSKGKVDQAFVKDVSKLLDTIMLQRFKDSPEVDLGLPLKKEVFLFVPLTELQRDWYKRIITKCADGISGNAWRFLMNLVMQLRKCCGHPFLFPDALPNVEMTKSDILRGSGKFIVLNNIIEKIVLKDDEKLLIFSQFCGVLDYCEELLENCGGDGTKFKYMRIDGDMGRPWRSLAVRMFQDRESKCKVLLISLRAGGLGLTLHAARHLVLMDEDWNPQVTLQAEARAHRIGQEREVTTYKLCTQGTVEEQMIGRVRKKLFLSESISQSLKNEQINELQGSHDAENSASKDEPPVSTTFLRSMLRQGTKSLSRPRFTDKEMLAWDYSEMIDCCQDKSSSIDEADESEQSEAGLEELLAQVEHVQGVLFEGTKYKRGASPTKVEPEILSKEDRRKGKQRTEMINGYAVCKSSLQCQNGEAVATLSAQSSQSTEARRESREQFSHQQHCQVCLRDGAALECTACARSYHPGCFKDKPKLNKLKNWYCPQHRCKSCAKNTVDAGGMLLRCRDCEVSFCEDCVPWENIHLIGDEVPELKTLGYGANGAAFYIRCPLCLEKYGRNAKTGKEQLHELSLLNPHDDRVDTPSTPQRIESPPQTPGMTTGTSSISAASPATPAPQDSPALQDFPESPLKRKFEADAKDGQQTKRLFMLYDPTTRSWAAREDW